MLEPIKKIDVHAHGTVFGQYMPKFKNGTTWPTAEDLIRLYDLLNIELGVLQPLVAPEALNVTMTNANCKYMVDQHPNRFTWFCNVDARAVKNSADSDLFSVIEHYKSLGAKGFGELTTHLPIDDPKMQNLFGCCQELDLPITIHLSTKQDGEYGIIDEIGLPRLENLLKTHPKLRIIGHSQSFWREIGDNPVGSYPTGKVKNGRVAELLRDYENLYADLSNDSGSRALMRDREHAARFIEEFSDKIMYACNICSPSNSFMVPFDEFLTSMRENGEVSKENYRKIVRENAIKILRLEELVTVNL